MLHVEGDTSIHDSQSFQPHLQRIPAVLFGKYCFCGLNAKQHCSRTNKFHCCNDRSNQCEPTVVFAPSETDTAHIVRVTRQHHYDGQSSSSRQHVHACPTGLELVRITCNVHASLSTLTTCTREGIFILVEFSSPADADVARSDATAETLVVGSGRG